MREKSHSISKLEIKEVKINLKQLSFEIVDKSISQKINSYSELKSDQNEDFLSRMMEIRGAKYKTKKIDVDLTNSHETKKSTNFLGFEGLEILMFLLKPDDKEELQAYLFDYRREMEEKGYPQWKINLITFGNILRVVVPKLFSAILGLARFWEKFNIG